MLRGFPQVFVVAPAVTLGLGSLPPERLKYASGLFNMMRNLGGPRNKLYIDPSTNTYRVLRPDGEAACRKCCPAETKLPGPVFPIRNLLFLTG